MSRRAQASLAAGEFRGTFRKVFPLPEDQQRRLLVLGRGVVQMGEWGATPGPKTANCMDEEMRVGDT